MTAAQREAIARRVCVNRGRDPDEDMSGVYRDGTKRWQVVMHEADLILEVLAAAYECAEEET